MSEVVENATFDERMYEKYELHYLPGRDRPAHVFDLVYGRRVTDPAEIGWLVATRLPVRLGSVPASQAALILSATVCQ